MTPRMFIFVSGAIACLPTMALAKRGGGSFVKYIRMPRDIDDPMVPVLIASVACLFLALIAKLISRLCHPGAPLWYVFSRLCVVFTAVFILAFGVFIYGKIQSSGAASEQTATVRYIGESGGAKFVTARQ
ncbi:MAG: hypothetical protein AAFQ64_20285 [Pseudomonadota bacterium]